MGPNVTGTLILVLLERSRAETPSRYGLLFVPGGGDTGTVTFHRCKGDATLLKILEEVLVESATRLAALDELRQRGVVCLSDVIVPAELLRRHGLASAA